MFYGVFLMFFSDVSRMRGTCFQCVTMRFSMFHEFVMSEAGQDGNVLHMFFYVLRSVF